MTPEQLCKKIKDFTIYITLVSVVVLIVLLFTIWETGQMKIRENETTVDFKNIEFIQGINAMQRCYDQTVIDKDKAEDDYQRILEQVRLFHGLHFPHNGDRPPEQMIEDLAQKLDMYFGDHSKWRQEADQ